MTEPLDRLLAEVRACTLCAEQLPQTPRPVLQAGSSARILIVGQAPGRLAHNSGKPFDDPSGDRLREWLGVDREQFYDPDQFAIVPMGFCYPGTGKGGDLPPRSECAEAWRARLLSALPEIELTVVLGRYALDFHISQRLGRSVRRRSVTELVGTWREHWPELVLLPHPSPRNRRWLRNNPWVEGEIVPALQARVAELLT